MLQSFVFPQTEGGSDINAIFQQNGVSPYYGQDVHHVLSDSFTNQWICRASPFLWLLRSPNLTQPYFFMWGCVKNIVYSNKIQELNHLHEWIIITIATVTPEMTLHTWAETEYCYDVSRAANEAHFNIF